MRCKCEKIVTGVMGMILMGMLIVLGVKMIGTAFQILEEQDQQRVEEFQELEWNTWE